MYIGEQIINPTAERLRLSAQLGVANVVVDTRPNTHLEDADGLWEAHKVAEHRRWIEGFGLTLECLALDVDSFLLDSLYDRLADQVAVEQRRQTEPASLTLPAT